MIAVKKLSNDEIILNADLIETIEAVPDTLISLSTGKKITVKDTVEEIVKRVIKYKQLIHSTVSIITKEEKK